MGVYFVHPELTVGQTSQVAHFYEACCNELEEHVDVTIIRRPGAAAAAVPNKNDAVVMFSRGDQAYEPEVLELLRTAQEAGADVFSVAVSPGSRQPPEIIGPRQSFDVTDELRRRGLTSEHTQTVAVALARTVVASLQPTLTNGRMQLFISYRRLDGEEIAAELSSQLRVRAERVFQDLIDIRVGEDAQEVIESRLRMSDAVVFIDTPRTGESEWVAKELEIALGLNLPIVWIRIGGQEGRMPLRVSPATATPHFDLAELATDTMKAGPTLVDDILHKAFAISRQAAGRVFEDIRRLKTMSRENGSVQLTEVDRRNLVYSVQVPRPGFRYRQRPMSHLIQFYGRRPNPEDQVRFTSLVASTGSPPHVHYDAAVMLAPVPDQGLIKPDDKVVSLDSCGEYFRSIQQYLRVDQGSSVAAKCGLILSGAFPDSEPEHQQHVTDAVHSFSQAILERSGVVIFGGHPTFQHLILDLAKRRRPDDFQQAVHLFLSRLFVTEAVVNELRAKATVVPTDAQGNSRAESLTLMRRVMIADTRAAALIAIGGKTATGVNPPGVDEEIALARSAGLPVFLIGSAGGRTAQIAADMSARKWVDKANALTADENDWLLTSLDYRIMADHILKHIGL